MKTAQVLENHAGFRELWIGCGSEVLLSYLSIFRRASSQRGSVHLRLNRADTRWYRSAMEIAWLLSSPFRAVEGELKLLGETENGTTSCG